MGILLSCPRGRGIVSFVFRLCVYTQSFYKVKAPYKCLHNYMPWDPLKLDIFSGKFFKMSFFVELHKKFPPGFDIFKTRQAILTTSLVLIIYRRSFFPSQNAVRISKTPNAIRMRSTLKHHIVSVLSISSIVGIKVPFK